MSILRGDESDAMFTRADGVCPERGHVVTLENSGPVELDYVVWMYTTHDDPGQVRALIRRPPARGGHRTYYLHPAMDLRSYGCVLVAGGVPVAVLEPHTPRTHARADDETAHDEMSWHDLFTVDVRPQEEP